MKIFIGRDYEEISKKAALMIAGEVLAKPNAVLGLATGETPIGTYGYLKKYYEDTKIDFSNVRAVNLDEYKGMNPDCEQSYAYFMKKNLFEHINIKLKNTYIQDALEEDSVKACGNYDKLIEDLGGIDLQLLGIGHNGHIGFNEPREIFQNKCHCVDLTESTIEANKRFFEKAKDVPKQAYTMGIGTIMKARKILLLVSGAQKAEILAKAIYGVVTPKIPASILQFHQNVTIFADEAAAVCMREQEKRGVKK